MKKMASDIQKFFQYVKKDYVKAISVYDEKGTIIYSTTEDAIGRNYANCDFSQWATKKENKGKLFISSLIRAAENQSVRPPYFRFVIAAPVYQEARDSRYPKPTHKFAGVLTYTIDLEEVIAAFLPLLSNNTTKQHVWIVDTSGTVLFQSEHPEMVLNSIRRRDETCMRCHISLDYVEKVLAEKQGTIEYALREQPKKSAAFAPLTFENVTWIIAVNVPLDEVSGFLARQLAQTLLLIAVIAVALVGASALLYRGNRLKIRAQEEAKQWREKRELEEKNRESEERYRQLVEISPDAIAVYCEGKIAYVNSTGVQALGARSADELIGKPAFDIVHPEDREIVKRRIAAVLAQGKPAPLSEERFLRLDGSVIDVEVASVATTFQDKPAVQVVARDITERKRAEEKLRHSEAGLKEAQHVSRLGSWDWDAATDANTWSEEYYRIYGFDPKLRPPEYQEHLKAYTPESAARLDAAVKHSMQTGEGYQLDLEQVCADGTRRWITARGEVKRDTNGQIVGLRGTAQDITERKRVEDALRASEEHYRELFENNPQPMWVSDRKTLSFLAVNEAAVKHYGYSREEFLSMTIQEIHPPELRVALSETVAKNTDVLRKVGVWQHRKKDGSLIDVEITAHELDFNGRPGRLVLANDITERKRAEEALRESEYRFKESQKAGRIGSYFTDFRTGNWKSSEVLDEIFGIDANYKRSIDGWSKLVHPEHRKEMIEYLNHIIGLKTPFEKEYRIIRPSDGEERWVSGHGELSFDEKGLPVSMIGTIQDITERKRAEEANTLLAQTLKSAQDCISITDLNDKILFVNHAFLATYGYHEEDLIGKNIAMVRPTSISPLQVGEILPSTLTGQWHGELINRRKGGTEFPIELWTSVVNDGEGNPIAAVGVARDITERKRAEEDLKKSEEKFRELFENAPIGYHELDAKGSITKVNLTELRMLGYTLEEMVGKPVWEFVGGSELPRKRVLDKLAGLLPPNKNAERTYIRKDGTTIPVMVDEDLFKNQRGEISGMRTVIQDITEKKRGEGALRRSEEKYRSLFKESRDTVYISTPNGKLLDINPAGVELLGYKSKEEMLQIDIAHGLFADPRQSEVMRQLMEDQGFIKNFEEVLRKKDGKKITVLDTASAVRDAKGRTVLFRGIMRDVTKEKQLEEELTQIQKLESIGTLASGIAHDFNNILGIVLGYSSLIEQIADDPEKLSQSVQSINVAVQRGASLVKQILTFARKAEVVFVPIDVNVMITEIVKMLRETFPKTIDMSLQLDRELPFIIADATQLHQVLLNISVNARDAMPIGGILTFKTGIARGLSLRNAFSGVQDGDYAHITITDTGVGMDDTTRAHIFDPFFTTKEKGKGTGLGLSVVYGVMKRHNGFIDVHSEPGKGTTFNLYFPISEENLRATSKQAEDLEEIPGGSETILIVEDEEALLMMLKVILELKGYHALTAVDGLEALALFREHKDEIALVVTDVGLPKISGDQLFFELKKVNPLVRVVLMSGYIDPELKSEIFKAGVHDFVQKPYDSNEVLKKVRESIDRK